MMEVAARVSGAGRKMPQVDRVCGLRCKTGEVVAVCAMGRKMGEVAAVCAMGRKFGGVWTVSCTHRIHSVVSSRPLTPTLKTGDGSSDSQDGQVIGVIARIDLDNIGRA